MKTTIVTASAALLASATAFAGAVGIDGSIGAEWTGANVAHVYYNPGAATSNFGSPTNQNASVAYDIYTRQDASYMYIGLATDVAQGGSADGVNFANLYIGNSTVGSYVGFEVTNDRAFTPGSPGYYGLAGLVGTADEVFWAAGDLGLGLNKTIEIAIPWSFMVSNPLGMGGWQALNPGDSLQLRLSQSFGYSVAGGSAYYGPDRLGSFTYPVPAPGALALLGMAGLAGARRRRA
ncbi:MAG: PEP-CTERM sorting domain-containing protein [Phycisphaerales bacterium]